MRFTILFLALGTLAVAGAVWLLFARRIEHAVGAFLACAAAIAGLYALLNLQYLAAVQAVLGVGLGGALLASSALRGEDTPPLQRIARCGIGVAPLRSSLLT